MERWRNADAYAAAVLNAAIDAQRLAVLGPIPASFLRAAAPAYCDNRAQAMAPSDWFEAAVEYCTHVLYGAAAALEPVASGMGEVCGYTLERALASPISARHRARLLALVARTHCRIGEMEKAGQVADRALLAAQEADDGWTMGWALHVLTIVTAVQGQIAEALMLFDRALEVTQSDPALTDLRLLLQVNKALTLGNLDRHDEALAEAVQACQLAERAGTVIRTVQAHSALGQLLFDIGRWAEAMAEVEAMPTEVKEPNSACTDLGIAAMICFRRGEIAAARRHLTTAAPYAEMFGNLLIDKLALACALDLATARALTGQAATLVADSEVPHRQASVLYCLGLLQHDPDGLVAAADRYSAAGRPLPHAAALEAASAEYAKAGDRSQARDALIRALEIYNSIGAAVDAARLQARFRDLSSPA